MEGSAYVSAQSGFMTNYDEELAPIPGLTLA